MTVDITAEWMTFVQGLKLDPDLEIRLLDPDLVDGAIEDLAVEDPSCARWVNACSHLTVIPSVLHAGF